MSFQNGIQFNNYWMPKSHFPKFMDFKKFQRSVSLRKFIKNFMNYFNYMGHPKIISALLKHMGQIPLLYIHLILIQNVVVYCL